MRNHTPGNDNDISQFDSLRLQFDNKILSGQDILDKIITQQAELEELREKLGASVGFFNKLSTLSFSNSEIALIILAATTTLGGGYALYSTFRSTTPVPES